ncbi:unnamed protein product [Litomosoides sigmodontis]|uniref:Secreted protein n=1 Tax=Litomosoides sigmodontis TaxID=42156 RepID=A0A3P6SLH9_LITSI|nr:unnamed protein product [Litomosoides sigmodontis]
MKLVLLFVSFLQQSYGSTKRYWRTWRDEHPQYRQLFSVLIIPLISSDSTRNLPTISCIIRNRTDKKFAKS